MPTSLDQILETTRSGLHGLRARHSEIEARAEASRLPLRFSALRDSSRLGLIAEVKRRSPSAGLIAPALDPVAHATAYARAGAGAISVLTDGPFFGGSLADLEAVTAQVPIPVLRKDFILDELQIAEARAAGASAILLIVRALRPDRLLELAAAARRWELEALVEVHDARELAIALDSGALVIGVNSRDLDTFRVDVGSAWPLLGRIPAEILAIAESGMATVEDARRAAEAGADAVLVGTALSSAPDPSALAAQLASLTRRGR